MESIRSLEERAQAQYFRASFKSFDAALARIETVDINPTQSLGQMLAQVASVKDPKEVAQALGKKLLDSVNAGIDTIQKAGQEIADLELAAKYLITGDNAVANRIKDFNINAHAKTVRAASDAGLLDAKMIATKIAFYVSEAKQSLEHLNSKLIPQVKSAADIAITRAHWISAKKYGHPDEQKYFSELNAKKQVHRNHFKKGASEL